MARNLLCSPDPLCRHIGLLFGERLDTLYVIGFENIRIHPRCAAILVYIRMHPSTRYRIRRGFSFFPLWRADLFFFGFAVEFNGCVWTVAVSGKKKLRIRGLRPHPCVSGYIRIRNFFFPDTATIHTHPANFDSESGKK